MHGWSCPWKMAEINSTMLQTHLGPHFEKLNWSLVVLLALASKSSSAWNCWTREVASCHFHLLFKHLISIFWASGFTVLQKVCKATCGTQNSRLGLNAIVTLDGLALPTVCSDNFFASSPSLLLFCVFTFVSYHSPYPLLYFIFSVMFAEIVTQTENFEEKGVCSLST